jgi:cob(I)alamin adenosyltransferase
MLKKRTVCVLGSGLTMLKGMIHVYTGTGKGKTTAAFGLAIRSAGHGRRVLILQFLKSRIKNAGEVRVARKSGIRVIKFKDQVSPIFDPTVKLSILTKNIKEAIAVSIDKLKSGKYDLVIMEEFNNVVNNGYATLSDLENIINAKPEEVELVFTGRGAPKELIDAADYVTDMQALKHPAKTGVQARKGIEY